MRGVPRLAVETGIAAAQAASSGTCACSTAQPLSMVTLTEMGLLLRFASSARKGRAAPQ